MLQIVQARNDLLSKLGIEDASLAPALSLQDVVIAINGAMQLLQTAGQDYFTREILTIALSAGTSIYTVPASVQSVLGPVRWNNVKPLRGLTSEGELDQFDRIFNGGTDYGIGTDGSPIAYFVKYLRSGTQGDICAISFRLAPAPSSPAGSLVAEVVNDAPSYVVADLTSTNVLPVAQNYTESIFLPIARLLITRSSQFSRPDILAQLEQDGQRALQALGLSGGFPNVDVPAPERRTEG
jgi:hypothetical protein